MAESIGHPKNIKSPLDIMTYLEEEARACRDFTGSETLKRDRKARDKDVRDTEYMSIAAGDAFEAILRVIHNVQDPRILKAFREFAKEYFFVRGGMNNLDLLYKAALSGDNQRLNAEMTKTFNFLYSQFLEYFRKTFHGEAPRIVEETRRAVNDTVPDSGFARTNFAERMSAQVTPHGRAKAVRGGGVSPR